MNSIEKIKDGIQKLYQMAKTVHLSVKMTHPRVQIDNSAANIIGVYKNIFQVEESSSGHLRRYTFQYNDVLIGHVLITELGSLL